MYFFADESHSSKWDPIFPAKVGNSQDSLQDLTSGIGKTSWPYLIATLTLSEFEYFTTSNLWNRNWIHSSWGETLGEYGSSTLSSVTESGFFRGSSTLNSPLRQFTVHCHAADSSHRNYNETMIMSHNPRKTTNFTHACKPDKTLGK